MKKTLSSIISMIMALAMLVGCTDASSLVNNDSKDKEEIVRSEDYNMLQTITIIGEDTPSAMSLPNAEPLDGTSIYPAYKFGNSLAKIVMRGWAVTNLSLYIPNGYVQLEVKGEKGGETFEVGFEDIRDDGNINAKTSTEGIAEVTTDWTTVTIPVSEIVRSTDTDLSCVRLFMIGNASSAIYVRNVCLMSPDIEKVFPEFKVNQLGYKPDSEKLALVTGFAELLNVKAGDTFELVDSTTDKAVFSAKLTLVTEYDEKFSGEKILCANFSKYKKEGTYYLRMKKNDTVERSLSFRISDYVYDELLVDTMRYYYYQRANTDITSEYGGIYTRSDVTPLDFNAPLSSNRDVLIDVSGGWYDAGDIGKYVSPGATAINTLLWTYKMFPQKFYDEQNNIPESGNGIPDILDEVRYELDFILRMQDPQSGGFYTKVKSINEQDSDGDRTVWHGFGDKCQTNATADCSAILAFASTIYKDFDSEYAEKMLKAAEKGWKYIEENPSVYSQTAYAGNENCLYSVFWASSCLYHATGKDVYKDYFTERVPDNYSCFSNGSNGHSVGDMRIYAYYTYLLCEDKDEDIAEKIGKKFNRWKTSVLQRRDENPWNISIYDWSFWWGSFNIILGNAQDMYIGNALLELDNSDAEKLSQDAVNFILGVNAMRKSYITGMGEDHIKCTFSSFYNGNSPDGVPYGYMPGGINSHNGGIISKYPIKCYIDDTCDWFTNENSIYWNAVMVFNSALVE